VRKVPSPEHANPVRATLRSIRAAISPHLLLDFMTSYYTTTQFDTPKRFCSTDNQSLA
jgi:hypothetical protein